MRRKPTNPAFFLAVLLLGACADDAVAPQDGATTGALDSTGPAGSEDASSSGPRSESESSDSSSSGDVPPALGPGNHALYFTASDGTEIAIDVWLPDVAGPVPTLMQMTRYWRAVEPKPGAADVDQWRGLAEAMNASGIAMVLVDARGSGASFGVRPSPWSPSEQRDFAEVARWVAEQPWSTGTSLAWGISYDGTAAELLAGAEATGLRGVGALFSDYDPYLSVARPGGILHEGFLSAWSSTNTALDAGDPCAYSTALTCEELTAAIEGVKPVDADADRSALAQAQAEHAGNVDVFEALANAPFRDSTFHPDVGALGDVSPYAKVDAVEAPTFAVASWFDAGTAASALARFQRSDAPQIVRIGAYSHAGFFSADPFMPFDPTGEPPLNAILPEMLDALAPAAFGAPITTRSIEYYVMGEGVWESTDTWPPADAVDEAWFFAVDGSLTEDLQAMGGQLEYVVDFSATTGSLNRWQTQLDGGPVLYGDRAAEDQKLLTFTSDPVASSFRIVGEPEVDLYVHADVSDAAFYGYLELVDPQGVVTYVSEGQLRAIHRRVVSDAPGQGVLHSFLEADALPLSTDGFDEVRFVMQPVAVSVPSGYSVRIALAGHDADSFERIPERGSVVWSVGLGPDTPSGVVLPIVHG